MTRSDTLATYSLETFENAVRAHDYAAALSWFTDALLDDRTFDKSVSFQEAEYLPESERLEYMALRLAGAIGAFLSDPGLAIGRETALMLLRGSCRISTLFAATGLHNADRFIQSMLPEGGGLGDPALPENLLYKSLLLYTANSEIPLPLHDLWRRDDVLAANLCFALLSGLVVATQAAHGKREALIGWLPARLEELDGGIASIPGHFINTAVMYSSYADGDRKHDIKRPINRMMRAHLLQLGLNDLEEAPPRRKRPVMLVFLEWFFSNHSVFRTHSATLKVCRASFEIVGAGLSHAVDETSRALFDRFVDIESSQNRLYLVGKARALAAKIKPDIVYYPSVGMFDYTIWLSNLRLAPIQATSTGHTATTHSEVMDYYIVDEDFIGDPACFSEKVIAMPPEAMPHVPVRLSAPLPPPRIREKPHVVRIAVPAYVMKLNPGFLEVCAAIRNKASRPVEFHFFVGGAAGLHHLEATRAVHMILPGAIVHPHRPLPDYLANLGLCDLFLSPFPFGNWNSIVDAVRVAVPGVCLSGREVHSHADEGFFRRFGLPDWLVARNEEEYVAAVLRLVHEDEERVEISRALERLDIDSILYRGRPEIFAEKIFELVRKEKDGCPVPIP